MAGKEETNWNQNSIRTHRKDLRWEEGRGGKKKRMSLKSTYRTILQAAQFTTPKREIRKRLSGEMEYPENRPPDTYNWRFL